ncbi:MAG: dephospho-CoA kinase [Legionella sp.]|nr:dephospho-CoA kinase [Legionella sp.]
MYCVGLTGNIASGKTTAIAFFRELGIAVINADDIARELTRKDEPAFDHIKGYFGESVINQEGELNRRFLRELIFSDAKKRLWLESLLHPLIKEAIIKRVSACESPYCVIEIPLLISRLDYPYLDRILVILADEKEQIKRLQKRDTCERESALAIIASQPNQSARREIADDLLINDDTLEKLRNNLKKLHDKYLQLATEKPS